MFEFFGYLTTQFIKIMQTPIDLGNGIIISMWSIFIVGCIATILGIVISKIFNKE